MKSTMGRAGRGIGIALAAAMLLLGAGCRRNTPIAVAPKPPAAAPKEVAIATPPAKPQLAQVPTIDSFTVEPSTMERGQSATLRWAVSNATEVEIDQTLGAVQAAGSRQVFPADTTTYTLTARSSAGMANRSVTVEVITPVAPPPPKPAGPKVSGLQMLQQEAQDAYFDFDVYELDADARTAMNTNAALLNRIFAQEPNFTVVIEGHGDERGSAEYNLGLGDRRATRARDYLIQLGVPAARIRTISYGEERPVCTDTGEACYQRNRRAHMAAGQ